MGSSQLPDFGSLYNRAADTLKTVESPDAAPQDPQKSDGLPNFDSMYAGPAKTIRQQNIDGINAAKSRFYDDLGLKPGALRGFIDMIPSALVSAMGTEPSDVTTGVKAGASTLGQLAGQLVEHPLDTSANLAKAALDGIAKPFLQYPLELMVNQQVSVDPLASVTGSGKALTPEERDQRARSIGANIVGWALGAKAEGVIADAALGQKAIAGGAGLKSVGEAIQVATEKGIITAPRVAGDIVDQAFSTMSTRDLIRMRDAVVAPQFMRTALGGAAGGALGGFTTGYLEGDTSAQRLEAGLSYAMVAMPLGVAITSVGAMAKFGQPVADMPDMIAMQAGQIAKLRTINAFSDLTPAELLFNINNLQQTHSLAATMALRDLEYSVVGSDKNGLPMRYGKNASVIPSVENPIDVLSVVTDHNVNNPESKALSVVHSRKDGLHDILVAPSDVPKAEQDFFAKTGYVHGQQVGYGGHDQWVIENVGIPDGKRSYRMELRNLITDERVQDVKTNDLVKLSSREPGDLRVHLGRLVTTDDIYDPAQGFALGKNMVKQKDISADLPKWREGVNGDIYDAIGTAAEYRDGKVFINGKELQPGLNKFEITNADHPWYSEKPEIYPPGDKRGVMIYAGGKMESHLGADGKPTQVQVGIPGDITSVMTWGTQAGYKRPRLGTDGFFSHEPAPNRTLATEALKQERVKMGLLQSNSTLSEGGAKALQNALNFYGRDRQVPGKMTVYTPEAIKTKLIEDFLDHTGATPDGRLLITPDEVIAYAGFQRGDQFGNRGAGESMLGHAGESPETILGRLPEMRLRELRNEGIPRLFTESKKPLSLQESVALIRDQLRSDAVPTVRSEVDRAIDRTEVSFNDMVNSFVTAQGIRPEVAPKVRNFLEFQLGRELLGMDGVRSRLVDRSSLPILEAKVNTLQKVIDRMTPNEKELSAADAEKLNGARDMRDVFTARVQQLKDAGPLPFTDQERTVYSRLVTEAQAQRARNATDLISTAQSNGLAVEREEGGAIVLRDAQTWEKLPQRFSDANAARDFINATGRAKGIELDMGGENVVPPSSVAGAGMLPPEPPPRLYEAPHQFSPDTRVSKIMTLLDTVAPWFTPKRAFMVALDNTFKTRFHDDVYLPLQVAKMKLEAMKRPFLEQAKNVEDLLINNKIDRERWQTITQYRESMSPQQIVDGLFKDRKLTNTEIDYAQRLVDQNIDTQKVFSYRRAVMELDKGFKSQLGDLQRQAAISQDPIEQAAINTQIKQLEQGHATDVEGAKTAFVMDDKHLAAVDMFNEIAEKSINEASLHGVTRLARAVQNGETNRAGFAAKNKMTGPEIQAATQLDALYSQVARHLNIDERITNYFNHFRAYTDLPDATPARLRQSVLRGTIDEMPQIASEMIRSGEMNVYETDPIRGITQYINSSFSHQHFNQVWKDARNKATEHLQQITKGRDAAANVINEYIGGMRGVPAASDQLAQEGFGRFMDAMGFEARPEIKKDIINTFLAASSGAFLGFRPAQGVRDFTQFAKIYYSRFGTSRFMNGLTKAFSRDDNGVMMLNKLAQEGTVPGLSVLQFASEQELADGLAGKAGKVKDAIFAASDLGLRLSGQHNAYAIAHAVAYLDTKELASNTLRDLSRGTIDKETAYKKLFMNSYDLPVAQGFDNLVTAGKMDQASEYLAQATGTETAFIFGLQNHPYGWGTNVGKLASQFGTWAVWTRNFVTRLAGRGTAGERAASMARFASAEVATGLASKALGFNLRSWYMLPGMIFMGGPAFDYAQQIEDMAGVRGRMRQDMANKQLTKSPLPVLSQLIPGGSAVNDYVKAYQLSQKRFGPVPVIGKGLGFSVDQTGRSWMDELMGNYPQTSPR
jgi:hypothetical protein